MKLLSQPFIATVLLFQELFKLQLNLGLIEIEFPRLKPPCPSASSSTVYTGWSKS